MVNNEICVKELFKEQYTIPIYQRNFAWGEEEIHQLIDDIISFGKAKNNNYNKYYYLGILVVGSRNNNEVVDGQQRLTTLYLIFKYLDLLSEETKDGALIFECRDKSNKTLRLLKNDLEKKDLNMEQNGYDENLVYAYKQHIVKYLEKYDKEKFIEYLNHVYIVKNVLSIDTDLNHYFELMNTRGEQLEKHDIVKSNLMDVIVGDKNEENKRVEMEIINTIWQACQNMDNYVQMNFNIEIRKRVFGKKWKNLVPKNYDSLIRVIKNSQKTERNRNISLTLNEILSFYNNENHIIDKGDSKNGSEKFESVLTFPNFLLQVNKAINNYYDKTDNEMLDDKELLNIFKGLYNSREKAKKFIYNLLKYRLIYDKYIIKRNYYNKESNDGEWSLKYLRKAKKNQPQYDNTFKKGDEPKLIIALESCLRITYTSPKTMDWIYKLMNYIDTNGDKDVLMFLEKITKQKVKEPNYKECRGFEIERIVYTYLDYILYRENIIKNSGKYTKIFKEYKEWNFSYRNSIEHFFPQNPDESNEGCKGWIGDKGKFTKEGEKAKNSFGNLALVTVSANSRFSNMVPKQKISESIINQSLKLIIMKNIVDKKGWTPSLVTEHEKEMFEILDDNINKS